MKCASDAFDRLEMFALLLLALLTYSVSGASVQYNNGVAVTGILGIGAKKPSSLLGKFGSAFWPAKWGYPPIGVYFADCPSAGHDMLCLDYRRCGPTGEPWVVHIDQESNYRITPVARDFESFIRGLIDDPDDA